jgi:hypothetical protein
MQDVLELGPVGAFAPALPQIPGIEVDEWAIRRSLREQIAKLEAEVASLFCSAYPRTGFDWAIAGRRGPRILSLLELEEVRDELAAKLQHNRRVLSDKTYVEETFRARIEEMLLEPEKHKWERVTNADIGETGCKNWHVRPRFGIVGMLMNWWRVKISSGCPLARGPRPPLGDNCAVREN